MDKTLTMAWMCWKVAWTHDLSNLNSFWNMLSFFWKVVIQTLMKIYWTHAWYSRTFAQKWMETKILNVYFHNMLFYLSRKFTHADQYRRHKERSENEYSPTLFTDPTNWLLYISRGNICYCKKIKHSILYGKEIYSKDGTVFLWWSLKVKSTCIHTNNAITLILNK